MTVIALRYDLRAPEWAATRHPELYAACLEQCAWADDAGLDVITFPEHHAVDDGFLPAPLVMAAAAAGRTRRIRLMIAAGIVPLHDPIRLAEQIAVLDLASGGRAGFVAGAGYVPREFEMAGVERSRRGALLEEYLDVMRRAWTGEAFEWRGRTIRVTPVPLTKPHPLVLLGGSSPAAARRAARLRVGLFAAVHDPVVEDAYRTECARHGFEHGFYLAPTGPGAVFVSEDPDRTWAQIERYAWYDASTYASWQTPGTTSAVLSKADTPEGLRREGIYRVLTPDDCVALAEDLGPAGSIVLHPLLCGIPAELGWESLELFRSTVLPRIRP